MDTPTLTKDARPAAIEGSHHLGGRYLIGPSLYPPYVRVARLLTVLLSVFTLIGLVSTIFEFSVEPDVIAEKCGVVLGLGLRSILMALGAVTLVFAAIQRFDISLPRGLFREPRSFPVEDGDRISLGEIARGIVLPAVSFICFNGDVDDIAWSWGRSYYSVIFDVLMERLAWINMTLLLYMALHVVLFLEQYWHWYTRLAKLMAEGLVLLLVLLLVVAIG